MLAAACSETPTTAPTAGPSFRSSQSLSNRYILVASSATSLPADLARAVDAAGGQLGQTLPQIGLAVATSNDPGFAANATKIAGVQDVAPDPVVQWTDPLARVVEAGDVTQDGVGDVETFRAEQWAPDAVSAPAAWNAGALGAGARVAIVDGGIRDTHIDIAPNLDLTHSISFVPG